MLHIVNGDSTARTLKLTKIKGDVFSFKDALINGPAPAISDRQEWRSIRSEHLAQSYGVKRKDCERELLKQEEVLQSAPQHDEVVLWFEHDLFCQLNLLYLLDWFSETKLPNTCLSMIRIGKLRGRAELYGLGELKPAELVTLFKRREPVTKAQLELGSKAWKAFRSPNPTAIELLLHNDTSALPFLAPALTAHLQRFPSTTNGLGKIEHTSLQFIDRGFEKFADVFPRFSAVEKTYGLGDAQLWTALFNLSSGKQPLLKLNTQAGPALRPAMIKKAGFKLTATGRSVLAGEADLISLNGIDKWLGGVHLVGKENVWRWHNRSERLALR